MAPMKLLARDVAHAQKIGADEAMQRGAALLDHFSERACAWSRPRTYDWLFFFICSK